MTDELWKDIDGYPNYMVSNYGRVKNCMRNKILRPGLGGNGYLTVCLYDKGIGKSYRLNRLVALAFIPNPDNKPEVNHNDEDKLNNFASNLSWMTKAENIAHSAHQHAQHYSFIKPNGERVDIFNLAKFCSDNNLNRTNMLEVNAGRRKRHRGWMKY